jgi:uncharacterized protein YkwD
MRRASAKILGLISAALVVVTLLLGVAFASPALAVSYSAEEIAFVQLLNEYRVSKGLQPLLVSDMISEACDRHNSDMGKYRFFDHYTVQSDWFAAGASPWDRMAASGYNYNTAKGENIAAGYSTASAVFTGWKNSSGHNQNMLSSSFKVVGVSMVYVSGSPYGYYWTTDFGGYVDPTAHSVGSAPTTTTTLATTTTTQAPSTTTTTRPSTTTTKAPTTTTTKAPTPTTTTTTTVYTPPSTTTTTAKAPSTTTPQATTSTTVRVPTPVFSDVTSSTRYAAEIYLMADLGVVSGYGNGQFGPTAKVTRQQFAKMIVLALGYEVSPLTASTFKDVALLPNSADPLYPVGYIATAAAKGITVGKTADRFDPYGQITRAQLITMVARAAELPNPPTSYTPPFQNFSDAHYPWARKAAYAGLLNGLAGYGPNYDFWAAATRGEVCLLLANLIR